MYPKNNGFTLIEILIALIIFSIIAVITSTVLYNSFNIRTRLNLQADRLAQLQVAMILVERDFAQATNRPINNPQRYKSAFSGTPEYVEFTSGGYINPLATHASSSLRRIGYLIHNQQLIRRTFSVLDPIQADNAHNIQDKVILTAVSSLQFQYVDSHLQLAPTTTTIPLAVQINLTLNNWGKMSLLFAIPIGAASAPPTL